MLGASEFGPDFQRTLVRNMLQDRGLLALVRKFVGSGQLGFTDPTAAWAWRVVSSTEYPTKLVLETESRRLGQYDPARGGLDHLLTLAEDFRDNRYVAEQIVEWARRQTFKLGFTESAEHYNAGRFEEAEKVMTERIREMQGMSIGVADRGWFFEELDDRQRRRELVALGQDCFGTGIRELDKAMNGGLSYGELGVPLAYSGIGKSQFCNQIGYTGVRMRGRVLHFLLEGGRNQCEDRYDAAFTNVLYKAVRRGELSPETLSKFNDERRAFGKRLVIRGHADKTEWHVTMDDIVSELDTLRTEFGWVPDVVIVDYGDLVHAPGDNERERQKNAFRRLKALAGRQDFYGARGYAVWAPSQAVRPGRNDDAREHILQPRDVADCYEKVRVADALISLNRTLQEKEDNKARVFLGKYRDSQDGYLYHVDTDYDHGRFGSVVTAVGFGSGFQPPAKSEDGDKPKTKRRPASTPPPPAPPPPPAQPPSQPPQLGPPPVRV